MTFILKQIICAKMTLILKQREYMNFIVSSYWNEIPFCCIF